MPHRNLPHPLTPASSGMSRDGICSWALQSLPWPAAVLETPSGLRQVNPAWQECFAHASTEGDALDRLLVRLAAEAPGTQASPLEGKTLTLAGQGRFLVSISVIWSPQGLAAGHLVLLLPVSGLPQDPALRPSEHLDPLTGLLNRRGFDEHLRPGRLAPHRSVGLILCNLNGLKLVIHQRDHPCDPRDLWAGSRPGGPLQ
nr:hypothetical protein [uncultured Holophaga sp.]